MSDKSSNKDRRVDQEQQYVKEKGQKVVEKAKEVKKEVKEGKLPVKEIPSNEKISESLQHGEESLTRFQESERGQQLGEPAQKVVEDLKNVISDQNALIQEKNAGDLLQNIIRHFWALLQELRHDESLRNSFDEWQGNFTSLLSSSDILQFVYQASDLFTSLQNSEEFLDLLMQLIDALKSIISDKTEQVNSGACAKEILDPEKLKQETALEREKILDQIKAILATLSENQVWLSFRERSRKLKEKAREAGDLTADQAKDIVAQVQDSKNFQELSNDFQQLLQRLIGDEKSVDPFFEHCKQAADEILNNDELAYVLEEANLLLKKIAEDPALFDDPAIQERATNLAERADKVLEESIKPKIFLAKDESKQLLCCIKSDPSSAKFLEDIKTLWKDLASDKKGEILDMDVLASIRQMLIPLLLEHLQNVPLPKIEGTASFLGKYDYCIDNMKISLPELIPDNVHLRFEMDVDAKPLELTAETKHTYLYLQASNIHAKIRDANWSYARRSTPKLHDAGIFDAETASNGITIWMKVEIKGDTKSGLNLSVLKTKVIINQNFHITFHESHHDKFYEMMTHLFAGKIKKSIIELMQEKLKLFGNYFSEQLVALIEQARSKAELVTESAKEQAREGIEKLKLQAKDKTDQVKEKASESVDKAKEKVTGSIDKNEVAKTKEEAKTTAKEALGLASEKIQEKLDDQKAKLEEKKKEKELDKLLLEVEGRSVKTHPNLPATSHDNTTPPPALFDTLPPKTVGFDSNTLQSK